MKRPEIHDALYADAADAAINSRVLRAAFKYAKEKYNPETDSFASDFGEWGVCIEDQHDNEVTPHYYLKFNDGNLDGCWFHAFHVRYCDYRSVVDENPMKMGIKENPGTYRIYVWLPKRTISSAAYFAQAINEAYIQAMIDELPDYEILTSDLMEDKK